MSIEQKVLLLYKNSEVGTNLNSHILQTFQNSKYVEQPNHKNDYNNRIQYIFNSALHGNVTVYQPEYNPGHNNNDKNS
jgi:hypothetical protein